MRICLIGIDKSETFKEIEPPDDSANPSIMQVADCYKVVSDGSKIPIFIPRMGNEATIKLCDYVFATYKDKNNE